MRKRTSSSGPPPVLGRERVDRHPLEADVERAFDGVEQRLLAGGVAVGALQPAPLRPAAVAVHDDRDVRAARARRSMPAIRSEPRAGTYLHSRLPSAAVSRSSAAPLRAWTAVVNPAAGTGPHPQAPPRPHRGARRRARLDVEIHVSDRRRRRRAPVARAAFADGPRRRRVRRRRHGERARRRRRRGRTASSGSCRPAPATTSPATSASTAKRWLDAVDVLAHGARRARRPRAGRATADGTSAWFTTVANTGFDAEANRWANGVRWATRHAALRARRAAHARVVPAAAGSASPSTASAHDLEAWLVAVGNTRSYAGGMMITPAPRSTTACSTSAWSGACRASSSCARSRRCSTARTSTIRR